MDLNIIEEAANSIREVAEKSIASKQDSLLAISNAAQKRFELLS